MRKTPPLPGHADFVDALGLQVVEDFQLHGAEDEALWGLASLSLTPEGFAEIAQLAGVEVGQASLGEAA